MGYSLIGYSGLAIGSAAKAVQDSLNALKEQGGNADLIDHVMLLSDRNEILELAKWQQLETDTLA